MSSAFRIAFGVALAAIVACSTPTTPQYSQRLVILGFDGLDPDLVEQFIADGKLPHFESLVGDAGLHRLETTVSSESEPAWASFATGLSPAGHAVFDARVRNPSSYATRPGLVEREPARFLLNYFPMQAPTVRSTRAGTPFWVTAGRAGVRSTILSVPGAFPADAVAGTEILASVPALDSVIATGAYAYFASDLAEGEAGPTPFGGLAARLVLTGDVAPADLVGPRDPVIAGELGALRAQTELTERERLRLEELSVVEHLRIPMTVRWNRDAPDPRTVTIEFEDQSLHLRQGEWSRWIDVEFRANLFVRFRAMTQILLVDASDVLQLYVSPLQWHPVTPPFPISSQPKLSAELYDRLGAYRTLGWAEATAALQEARIDERAFLDDLDRAFDDRAELILSRLDRPNWNLLVGVVEATDRVQHMMWRLIDPRHPRFDADLAARYGLAIEQIYRRCDDLIGEVLRRLDPGTPLLVLSDHGFHSWRRSVHLNSWLVEEGYMALRDAAASEADADGEEAFERQIDWTRTRAYAIGPGQIFVNLEGREPEGIVSAGAERSALADEIAEKLTTLTDPADDTPMVSAVYRGDTVHVGPHRDRAPDLQVGFADGYRVSWPTTVGQAPPGLVVDNEGRWSGDHGGFDFAATAGVLVANRPLAGRDPRLVDLAPTVLAYFGLQVPPEMEGLPLF